ncbi:MAG: LysR family transcriptional regulator [Pseudomonadota bacterium]
MWVSDADLRLLRVFRAVAKAGGFVKAQDELGINQPAISSHIANLEQRLGVRLCERGRGGFALTQAGEEVLREAQGLLDQVEACSSRLQALGKRTATLVRVGVVDGLSGAPGNPLPEAMSQAKARLRDLRIRVGIYDYLDCLNAVLDRELDIGIVGVGEAGDLPSEVEAHHLFDETSGLYCTPGHACAQEDTADAQLARLREARISAQSFVQDPVGQDLSVILHDESVEISQGNVEATLYLALAGSHVGLIPDHLSAPWVEAGRLVPVLPERLRVVSSFYAIRRRDALPTKGVDVLWSALVDGQP